MANPFVAEIRLFPFSFVPSGWAWCNGQLLPLSQNTALFSLLGTTYGGNGSSTFALPDLRGMAPMQHGQGTGLTMRELGESGGSESVTLLQSEMPQHGHALNAAATPATYNRPSGDRVLAASLGGAAYSPALPGGGAPSPQSASAHLVAPVGGDYPHNNMQPYLALHFAIALQGVFPSRP